MVDKDKIQRFLFDQVHARGELVHVNESFQALIAGHDYPEVIQQLLGEAMVAVSLMVAMLKFDGNMTLQIQGDGDVSLLIMQVDQQHNIRGMAQFKNVPKGQALADVFGKAQMVISLQGRASKERYQGIVSMDQGTLAGCLEAYFQQSEQLDTHIQIYVEDDCAAGLLLQAMPAIEGESVDLNEWHTLCVLSDTLTLAEMMRLDNASLIGRLFSEYDVHVFEQDPIAFFCSCSRDKINQTLIGLGQAELTLLLQEEGEIRVDCEFCNHQYQYDAIDVDMLFSVESLLPVDRRSH